MPPRKGMKAGDLVVLSTHGRLLYERCGPRGGRSDFDATGMVVSWCDALHSHGCSGAVLEIAWTEPLPYLCSCYFQRTCRVCFLYNGRMAHFEGTDTVWAADRARSLERGVEDSSLGVQKYKTVMLHDRKELCYDWKRYESR